MCMTNCRKHLFHPYNTSKTVKIASWAFAVHRPWIWIKMVWAFSTDIVYFRFASPQARENRWFARFGMSYARGGGGYIHNYVCILGICRKRDHHFQPWISVPEHIIFTNYQKNPFRSITILHILADFAVPETIIFKISLISTRSSPPTAAAHGLTAVPEIRIFKRLAAPWVSGRSGDSHFQAFGSAAG